MTCHVKVSLKMESISTWESVRLSTLLAAWTKVSKVRNLVLRNHRLLRRGRRQTFSDLLFLYFFVFIHNKYQISHHYAKPLNGEPALCLASHQRCLRATLKEKGEEGSILEIWAATGRTALQLSALFLHPSLDLCLPLLLP